MIYNTTCISRVNMKIDFTRGLNAPNQEFDFAFEWEHDKTMFESVPHRPLAPGEVRVNYKSDDEGIISAKIEVRVPFKFVCDKCADEFEKNLYLVSEEKIEPDGDEAEGFTYDSNGETDISFVVSQVVLSSFPQSVTCSPNCKGLCPVCGENLNYDTCDREKNKTGKNNPFGELLGKIQ